jgi:hypothetical protein
VWAGVDNAWEQEKLEARKMLAAGAAESHTSGARFVGTLLICKTFCYSDYVDLNSTYMLF